MALSLCRSWLSYPETANYLSEQLGQKISICDIARLVADEEIPPSIYFQHPTTVRKVVLKTVPLASALEDPDALIKNNLDMLNNDAVFPESLIQHAIPINNEIIRVSGLVDALPCGVIKHFNENLYSEGVGLNTPLRSLYATRGIILIKGCNLYQVITPVDVGESLKILTAMQLAHGDDLNPLVGKHIAKLTHIENLVKNGDITHQLMPCSDIPSGALPVIQSTHITKLLSRINNKPDKKTSSKTTNAMASFIYSLIATTYGEDVAKSPRSHLEDSESEIRKDFELKGFSIPSGNTVAGWLKNVNP